MIAYRKQRRKVDPVKQILARVEERQNKSGLSLYSTKSNDEPSKDDILPMVHQLSDGASISSKNTPFLADLSTARQKAHRRLNASSKHIANENKEKSMPFALRGGRQLNLTFPPANPQKMTVGVNMNNLGYSFSGWSESSSAGVENLRSSHYTTQSMNPFGYSRRTLAFQPTSLNYVVEWPETWPLKIMSLNKGMGRSLKKKPRTKPKDERRVRFEQASAHLSSPLKESISSGVYIQEGVSAPARSSLELGRKQQPLPSVSTQPFLQEALGQRDTEVEELHGVRHQCEAVSSGMLAPCSQPPREENLRGSSGVSSVSAESAAFAMDKEIDEDRELEESGTKVASVPPCTPTPDIAESEQEIGSTQLDSLADDWQEEGEEKKESKEVEEEEEEAATVEGEEEVKDDAQAKLMSVVSRIATEPSPDYKQDI